MSIAYLDKVYVLQHPSIYVAVNTRVIEPTCQVQAKTSLEVDARGPKDLKNDTGSVIFLSNSRELPHPPKRDMLNPERQFQEKHIFKMIF